MRFANSRSSEGEIMKSKLWLLILVVLCVASSFRIGAQSFLHHSLQATLLVADPDKTADLIAQWSESSGGDYLLKSSDRVIIRFPSVEMPSLRKLLERSAEEIIQISPQAVDLRESVLGLESGIRSREEILEKNLSFIDKADIEGTLAIETEIVQLLKEIESLKGQLRKLSVDRVFSRGDIALSFMQQSLPEDIPSSFGWINTVDFYRFTSGGYR